jgi:aspartate carbamoyltransferase regulatory subunit
MTVPVGGSELAPESHLRSIPMLSPFATQNLVSSMEMVQPEHLSIPSDVSGHRYAK